MQSRVGCAMHYNALKCVSESIVTVELLSSIAAGKTNFASVAGCKIEADSPAGRPRAQAQRT